MNTPKMLCLVAMLVSGLVYAQSDDPVIDDKPLSEWIKQLRSDNRGFQVRASRALSGAPTNLHARIMPLVIPILKSERENDKFVAAQVLGVYGAMARVAVPDLLPMLEGTQYERNRAAAAKALGQILKNAEPCDQIEDVTKRLVILFNDRYVDARTEAVTACGTIGLAAKSCIPALASRIGEAAGGSTSVREAGKWAVWACGQFGPLAACHIDRMISIMHGGPVAETIEAIGKIGPVNEQVVPNMVDRLEFVASGGVVVPEGYRTHGMDNIGAYMDKGFEALARCGPKAAPAVPYLQRVATKDRNKRYVLGALKALAAIGPAAKDAAEPIEKTCLASKDADIKKAAEETLAKIR